MELNISHLYLRLEFQIIAIMIVGSLGRLRAKDQGLAYEVFQPLSTLTERVVITPKHEKCKYSKLLDSRYQRKYSNDMTPFPFILFSVNSYMSLRTISDQT